MSGLTAEQFHVDGYSVGDSGWERGSKEFSVTHLKSGVSFELLHNFEDDETQLSLSDVTSVSELNKLALIVHHYGALVGLSLVDEQPAQAPRFVGDWKQFVCSVEGYSPVNYREWNDLNEDTDTVVRTVEDRGDGVFLNYVEAHLQHNLSGVSFHVRIDLDDGTGYVEPSSKKRSEVDKEFQYGIAYLNLLGVRCLS